MEVHYTLTFAEVLALLRQTYRTPEGKRRARWKWYAFGVFVLCWVGLYVWRAREWPMPQAALYWIPVAGFGLLALVWRRAEEYMLWERLRKSFPQETSLRIGPDGLTLSGRRAVQTHAWTQVEKVETTPTHAFFYLKGAVVVALPRRAFDREADFRSFVETAERYRAAACPSSAAAR